jgi:lysophospholipase L1-like esterase
MNKVITRLLIAACIALPFPCWAADPPIVGTPGLDRPNVWRAPQFYSQVFPLAALARSSAIAATSNPRSNPVMASPPALTIAAKWTPSAVYPAGAKVVAFTGAGTSTIGNLWSTVAGGTASTTSPTGAGPFTDGTITWTLLSSHPAAAFSNSAANSYLWNTGTGKAGLTGVVTYLGGTPTNNVGTGYEVTIGPTVAGVPASVASARTEFATDSAAFYIRVEGVSVGLASRLIVNGQYVSLAPLTSLNTGYGYILVDFTAAGGRQLRNLLFETQMFFGGVDVLATEGVYQVQPTNDLTLIATGDSITAGSGATPVFDGYGPVLADLLGVHNWINTAIGGTGYTDPSTSGTALSRLTDITNQVALHPNAIILDGNGHNDVETGIRAACVAYLQALRAVVGPYVPIIETGIWPVSSQATVDAGLLLDEPDKIGCVADMNDPLIMFIPFTSMVGGSPLTGTGQSNDVTPTGTGNGDIYVNGSSLPHPNAAGHSFLAHMFLEGAKTVLHSKGY